MIEVSDPDESGRQLRLLLVQHGIWSCLDLGSGLAPQEVIPVTRHVCVDAHQAYLDKVSVERPAVECVRLDLADNLPFEDREFCLVWLGDVLEHLERLDGERLLAEARRCARRFVVVRSPLGFLPQEGDAWNMGGEHWQKHRSGWTPEDLGPGLVETWVVPPNVIPGCTTPWFQAMIRA